MVFGAFCSHLLVVQGLPTFIIDDPRRPNRSRWPQWVPPIQKELWNAQVVWRLWTFAMNGTKFVDLGHWCHYYSRHFGVCLLSPGVRLGLKVRTGVPFAERGAAKVGRSKCSIYDTTHASFSGLQAACTIRSRQATSSPKSYRSPLNVER